MITEHILENLFAKALQGALFVKLRELIMGWKHMDALYMGLYSTKECVVTVNEFKYMKVVIESNIGTKDKTRKRNNAALPWSFLMCILSNFHYDICTCVVMVYHTSYDL